MCFGLKTQSSFGRFGLTLIFLIWLLRAAPASADRLELGGQLDGWDCAQPDVMVSSADGLDLYVGGSVPNIEGCLGFAWFRRDPATGRLALRKVWGQQELDRREVGGLALSHDGRNLYVGASDDILTYARGPGGDLEKVGDEVCCTSAYGVAVSPDDAEVWVLGYGIKIYSRSASGALTLKQSLESRPKPAYTFIDANNAFVGQNLLHRQNGMWSYGQALRETDINSAVVDAGGDYLHVIGERFDSTQLATYDLHSDSLIPVHALTLGEFALGLARDPRTGDLYALSGVEEGEGLRAQVRRFTTSSGGQVSAAGAWVENFGYTRGLFLAISPDGRHLYTSFENENVALLEIHPSGLTSVPGGVDPAARLRLPARAVPAGSGKFYLPVDREIQLARRSGSRYEIVESFAFKNWLGTGYKVRFNLALTPDLTLAAVVSGADPGSRYRLALADLDPATGRIALREETSLELAAGILTPTTLEFSHDGKFLYVLVGTSLRIYRLQRSPLRLELVGSVYLGPGGASEGRLVISPDGRDAFFGGVYFLRDLATGLLTPAPSPFPDPDRGGKAVYIRDGRLLVVLTNGNLGFQHLLVLERTGSGWSLLADQALPGSRNYYQLYADPQGRRLFLDVTQPEAPYQKGLQLWEWDAGTSPFRFAGEIEGPLPNGIRATWPFYSLSRDGNEVYASAGSDVNMVRIFRAKCEPGSAFSTCLGNGRFRAEIDWRDAAGAPHPASPARVGADDSRLFTFFDADNWEVLTKVLDGCAINQRFWVFSAATTDVGHSLRVTDTWSGQEVIYTNPAGTPAAAITDGRALDVCGVPDPGWIPVVDPLPPVTPAGQLLEVQNGRFEVSATWITASGQQGEAQALSARTTAAGLFYFFSPNNWEIQAKVLDGCAINNRIWFYAAATTDVGYTLKVRDRLTGSQKTYQNPVGQAAPAITDSNAFPCP